MIVFLIQTKRALITKKFREMSIEIRHQVLTEEMGDSGLVVMLGSNRVTAEIALFFQNSQSMDIPDILEFLVENRRKQKNQH
ncbi:hypothetical protein NIES4075_68970 [Tolypothrix sp. NIES-4075]|nr:hypothetical protein NIES4075_68970 [Tolypothrix sp. NIES-4075]